ncbi:MAG: hypothetical protein FWG29_06510 [Treponema sp.]|nr:hypothetical protein [Treponema sp.]
MFCAVKKEVMMKTYISITIVLCALLTLPVTLGAQENLASVSRTVPYSIRDSADYNGNLYISAWSQLPSVLTCVNGDGSVAVCSSDGKTTYIYEYDSNLKEQNTLNLENEYALLGAFTRDDDGNYYLFYAARAANQNTENMAMVKYSPKGEKLKTYTLKARAPNSFSGISVPFDAGTCRLELSGGEPSPSGSGGPSMLAVYFARKMFDGHQASYGFVLDKDTFERVDTGAATNANRTGGNTQMPYVSHSFNQFILPAENGFVFADHGDAYPRAFTFAKFQKGRNTMRVHAFGFAGSTGQNATYAEMGGLAKTQAGYIFAGTYGVNVSTPRNLFVLTVDEDMNKCSAPVYLTKYTKNDGHAGHPKIVALDNGRYLVLWELFKFSTQSANSITYSRTEYLSTWMLVIDETGKAASEAQELKGIRLNMNDTLRYNRHNGKAYWAINNGSTSITVYALDVKK